MGECQKIFIEIQNIIDWESCVRSTADLHYLAYCEAFEKSGGELLTILEYAAIKNIDPAELFLRLNMNISIFNQDELALCMMKLRRKLEMIKQKRAQTGTAAKPSPKKGKSK
jgi:hypothetical protein